MPYKHGSRLPGERASRLGHLEVLKSDLVNSLVQSFESLNPDEIEESQIGWEEFNTQAEPLSIIFGVDGSLQAIESDIPPYKALAFVKTALLRLDQVALSKIDQDSPNPFSLRDILSRKKD